MSDPTPRTSFSDYLSTAEAAEFLGISMNGVYLALWRGTLTAVKPGRDLWIHIDDLRAYAARQEARARGGEAKRAKRAKKAAREAAQKAS